jgi:hypothetical protein
MAAMHRFHHRYETKAVTINPGICVHIPTQYRTKQRRGNWKLGGKLGSKLGNKLGSKVGVFTHLRADLLKDSHTRALRDAKIKLEPLERKSNPFE